MYFVINHLYDCDSEWLCLIWVRHLSVYWLDLLLWFSTWPGLFRLKIWLMFILEWLFVCWWSVAGWLRLRIQIGFTTISPLLLRLTNHLTPKVSNHLGKLEPPKHPLLINLWALLASVRSHSYKLGSCQDLQDVQQKILIKACSQRLH